MGTNPMSQQQNDMMVAQKMKRKGKKKEPSFAKVEKSIKKSMGYATSKR